MIGDNSIAIPCGLPQGRSWAVRNQEVYICEGSDYFNRPGPRLVDSLEILGVCPSNAASFAKWGKLFFMRVKSALSGSSPSAER